MKANTMIAAAAMAASVAAGATTTVTYDASNPQPSYAGGAVAVTYDGGTVTGISADATVADGVIFTGDALTFSPGGADVTVPTYGSLTFNNALNATGASSAAPAEVRFRSAPSGTRVVTLPTRLTYNEQLVARGMTLSQITNLVARFDKDPGQGGSGIPCDNVQAYFYTVDRATATCQFQKKTSSAVVRVVCVTLAQRDDGIYASTTAYGHFNPVNHGDAVEGDIDITKTYDTYQPTGNSKQYYVGCFVTNLTVYCSSDVGGCVALNGNGAFTETALRIGDGEVPVTAEIGNKGSFPASGMIEVNTNSHLTIKVGGENVTGLDRYVPIVVRKGGVLTADARSIFDASYSDITLDGGTLSVKPYAEATADWSLYVSAVKFRNGARMNGSAARVRSANTIWTIEGETPSRCDNIIDVWNYLAEGAANYKITKFTLDVADVTNDPEPDFICAGTIRPTPTTAVGYTKARVVKTGAGTLSIGAHYMMTNTPTRIESGTFLVNGDHLTGSLPCHFVLAGGVFAVPAGSTNTCGTLEVESASVLSVADGASLSFADSSALAWGGTLTLDADLSACTVRFGTGKTGLSTSQRRKITTAAGGRVRLDDSGRLYPAPICFTISFR